MKKLFTIFFLLVASVGTILAWDYIHVQVGDLYYNLDGNNRIAEVTYENYNSPSNYSGLTTVTIPSFVYYNSVTYRVTSIEECAFWYCTGLINITIPNTVTHIGNGAFWDCSSLSCVTIPNSVTSIGRYAFAGCSGLTSVTIPNSVVVVGENAFSGCSGLTSVYISDIAVWCGVGFGNLASNPLSYAKYFYLNDIEITDLVIPDGVSSIGIYAFYNCSGITNVTIPNSVTSIGEGAFSNCTGLTSVTIPNSVTSIGRDAFYFVPNIVYSGTAIGYNLWGARSVNGYVDGYLVYGDTTKTNLLACSAVANGEVVIPNSVRNIANNAFYNCSDLTSIEVLHETPPSLGSNVFKCCDNLAALYVPCGTIQTYKNNWSEYQKLIKYHSLEYTIEGIVDQSEAGNVTKPSTTCDESSVSAVPNYGYHFVQWSDGVTDNPRTIVLSQDTTFTAEFARNAYSITKLTDENRGSISGPSQAEYLDSVEIVATSNYGYRFDHWMVESEELIWDYTNNTPAANPDNGLYFESRVNDNDLKGVKLNSQGYCYFTKPAVAGMLELTYGPRKNGTAALKIETWSGEEASDSRPTAVSLMFTTEEVTGLTTIYVPLTNVQNNIYIERATMNETVLQKIRFVSQIAVYGATLSLLVENDKTYTAIFAKNTYSITKIADKAQGSISGPSIAEYLDSIAVTAVPNYGYHFVQWSDSVTTNPRVVVLTQDTTITAEFAPNTYTITTESTNPEWGETTGDTTALHSTNVQIEAIPNHGYHFAHWNDGSTSNPRIVEVVSDYIYRATFVPNTYSITKLCIPEGSILGNSQAQYLDSVRLEAIPNYGYHFIQWSDGVTTNPRIVVLTQDTTFTAEFAIDITGACGDANQLTWTFDSISGTLAISGNGTLNSNYTFGGQSPSQTKRLIIEEGVTSIGNYAFYGMGATITSLALPNSLTTIGDSAFMGLNNRKFNTLVLPNTIVSVGSHAFDGASYLKTIHFGSALEEIGEFAFNGCTRVQEMTCLAEITPNVGTDALTSINSLAKLYVPSEYLFDYQIDPNWSRFAINPIGTTATTVATDDVQVAADDNTATLTWPTNDNADSYFIEITKDGVVFCTLTFNANGQLTGIAFAPSREAKPYAPAATMTANGMQFTVTGLNSGTNYAFSLAVRNGETVLASYTGEFVTTGAPAVATGTENVSIDQEGTTKLLRDGQILILRGNHTYTLTGQEVK